MFFSDPRHQPAEGLSTIDQMITTEEKHRNETIWRAYSALALFIALKAVGNLSLAWGMKRFPQTMSASPLPYLHAMLDPLVALGIVTLILALLTRMALFSLADLSFVLPVTAVGYIIAVVLGKLFLHETISPRRWAGAVLIALGAALVGSGSHKTEARIE
jgi:drug/metabolite transporter (DMT)-like permease